MANKPKKPQNEEAVELLDKIMEILGCSTDAELAAKLSKHLKEGEKPLSRTQLSNWRANGFPKNIKVFILTIIHEL